MIKSGVFLIKKNDPKNNIINFFQVTLCWHTSCHDRICICIRHMMRTKTLFQAYVTNL